VVLEVLKQELSICRLAELPPQNFGASLYFLSKTDEEISLVCVTEDCPSRTLQRDDGWRAFRVQGVLDFSLVGILSRISAILAENGIGIFAVSTYNTDYILTRAENFADALRVLAAAGYEVTG
jgi:uncharacterized protein